MSDDPFVKLPTLKDPAAFRANLHRLEIEVPFDDTLAVGLDAPLAQPIISGRLQIPNRFAIQPMEGWDAETDGRPSERTVRRWQRFGGSGAGLIWGGEAVAISPDARANPHQLLISQATADSLS